MSFLITYLIIAKVLRLFNFLWTIIEFLVKFFPNNRLDNTAASFGIHYSSHYCSVLYICQKKNWNKRNTVWWCLKLNIIWLRYMLVQACNLSHSQFFNSMIRRMRILLWETIFFSKLFSWKNWAPINPV